MKLTKKIVSLLMALCLVLGLAACGTQGSETKDPANDNPPVSDNTPTTNPDDSNISEEKKPVILAVSFGTSYKETRDITIGAIEEALQAASPEADRQCN